MKLEDSLKYLNINILKDHNFDFNEFKNSAVQFYDRM